MGVVDSQVFVRLLGSFSVTFEGKTLGVDDFRRRSGAELVQLLALAPGGRRHREQVFDILWPDASAKQAANRMYQAASHARKALGTPDAVVLRGEIAALFPDHDVVTDVAVIESADLNDHDSLTAALAAWGGELLADSPYAEWAIEARARAHQRYVELLAVAGRWRTVVEIDPANEDAHVALMGQALEVGDPHGALHRFETLERVLDEELGVTPSAHAEALRDKAQAALARRGRPVASVAGLRVFMVADVDPAVDEAVDRLGPLIDVLEHRGGAVFDRTSTRLGSVSSSVLDAVRAAVECQQVVQATADGDRLHHGVRVGIDIGEAESRGAGWVGHVVDRATAIAVAGSGDQIVCSSLVAELAGPDLGEGLRTIDLGLFRLPDLPPVALHRIVAEGLKSRSSPLRVSRLAGRPVGRVDDAIFGRDRELEGLSRELETARLVTLVGPGGAGKTHVARHLGSRRVLDHPGGVWMCELATVSNDAAARQQLLLAVGGQRHTDTTVTESIIRTLADRSTLVIVDNCEHVLESISELCVEILDRCPEVHLLATSREPLGLSEEVVLLVGELDRDAAIELFVSEGRRHGVSLDQTNPAINRICERLDDLPLAVQLAAARTRVLDLETVESLLSQRLDALRRPGRDGPAHHATLRAAIAWSVDALDTGPHSVLVDLSVLANRFTLDAAIAVASRTEMTSGEVLDHFDELVRRSLVSGPTRVDGEATYRLLESVRLFARELITDQRAADRHLAYFVDRVESSDAMERDELTRSMRRIGSDWDDIRRAWGHAVHRQRHDHLVRLLGGVASYSVAHMRFEYLQWCEDSLPGARRAVTPPARPIARSLAGWAALLGIRGELDRAMATAKEAHALEPTDELALWAIAWAHLFGHPDPTTAKPYLEEIVADRANLGGSWRSSSLIVLVIFSMAEHTDNTASMRELEALAASGDPIHEVMLHLARGRRIMATDPDAALQAYEDAIALAERYDLREGIQGGRTAIVAAAAEVGTVPEALTTTHQNLDWFAQNGLWTIAMNTIPAAAAVLERADRDDIATTVISAHQASGLVHGHVLERGIAQIDRLRERHPDDFDTWWASGQQLDPPTLCALTLTTIETALAES